jgi:hypothetical protein
LPGYQQIPWAATELKTDAATLLDFSRRGWISTVEKNGLVFIATNQRYRAKYILHLRQTKSLSDEQIELVLSVQRRRIRRAGDEIANQPGTGRCLGLTCSSTPG